MNLLKLAKSNDFTNDFEYLDYIIESWYNGQKTQFFDLFKAMDKSDRTRFFEHMEETSVSFEDRIKITNYLAENL